MPSIELAVSCIDVGCTRAMTSSRSRWSKSVRSSANLEQGPNGGCYGPPELGNECDTFWSSTEVGDGPGSAWFVSLNDGHVWSYSIGNHYHARCVRP
jgi:hypothetical protein